MKPATSISSKALSSKGFSILEIVVAISILAVISLLSTRLIQSSLETKRLSEHKLAAIKKMSLASSIMRSDLANALSVELKNFLGQNLNAKFILDENLNEIKWISMRDLAHYNGSPVRRLVYQFKNNSLYRRQYFAEHPAEDEFLETKLLSDISEWKAELYYQNRWLSNWPLTSMQKKTLPKALRISFKKNRFKYTWLIDIGRFDG